MNWGKVITDYYNKGEAYCPKCGEVMAVSAVAEKEMNGEWHDKKCYIFKCNHCNLVQPISGGSINNGRTYD